MPITAQVELRWGPGAKEVWDQLDLLASEPDRMKQTMFSRVGDMTVRLASIVAFGRGSQTVDEPDMLWARAITMRSAQDMYEAVLKHMEDPKSHNAMCQEILEMFAESPRRLRQSPGHRSKNSKVQNKGWRPESRARPTQRGRADRIGHAEDRWKEFLWLSASPGLARFGARARVSSVNQLKSLRNCVLSFCPWGPLGREVKEQFYCSGTPPPGQKDKSPFFGINN